VISALLYLQFNSLMNRTVMRFKRLKQPKYLVGGIVGAIYFYFYFFRYLFSFGRHRGVVTPSTPSPDSLLLYESLGALVLFILVFFAWVLPNRRAALAFTETEIAFLFPAPITRRGLILYKLLRSQASILFTTFILTLVSNRFSGHRLIHGLGWWIILSTLNLHFIGASFARTFLLDRGISNTRRRIGIITLVFLLVGGVAVWAWKGLPHIDTPNWKGTETQETVVSFFRDSAERMLVSGPLPYILLPFRAVVRPYLAQGTAAFLLALAPALLLLALHYFWILRSDVAFEEASVEASRKTAERVAAIRAGKWNATGRKAKVRRAPFKLHPLGPPALALFWKNLISAGQAFTLRFWIVMLVVGVTVSFAVGNLGSNVALPVGLGSGAAMLMIWSLFLGPQVMRQDLRQDLPLADVLKTYPLRGWQIVFGELLAPAVILTGFQWFLLVIAVLCFAQAGMSGMRPADVVGLGLGAALIIPALNLLMLQIPNGAVLLFPAWFQPGKDAAQGIEATGQRIIGMLGQVLVFFLALIPAALAFALVLFVLWKGCNLPLAPVFPIASAAAALAIAGEAVLGCILLGSLFEKFDLSAELNP